MLKGVLLKDGIYPAKNMSPQEVLKDDGCAVIIDDENREIYLWVGSKAKSIDKFKAARLAHMLNWRLFGGAARIVQDRNQILNTLEKFSKIDDEIPSEELKAILG
ncbi:MAG: hypothetical protein ACTSX9_07525 [Candidatus Njordarchaeales archaeon]